MRELLMQHPQGLVVADQRPSIKTTKKLHIKPQTEIRGKEGNKNCKKKKYCLPYAYKQCAFPEHIFHCVFALPIITYLILVTSISI